MIQKRRLLYVVLLILLNGNHLFAQKQPNIIFILADDLGWADLPCYGNTFNESPNMDQLAREGMRFTNAYAAAPVCSPTRASIQSGQYPARVGVIDFIPGHWRPYEEVIVPKNRNQFLPENIVTLAESIKKAGYTTGYFGKWHLGHQPQYHPSNQGYDVAYEYATGGVYNPRFKPELPENSNKRLSDILDDLTIDFIKKNKSKPFFLFQSHFDVHVQLDADQDLIDKYKNKQPQNGYPGNAVYAAMIEHIDRSVGKIMKTLKEEKLEKNTMVIFYSDNGGLIARFDKIPLLANRALPVYESSPLQYIASSNAPLRSEKGTVYEGGIREPLIIKWPEQIKPGSVSDALVTSPDFYATFLDMLGIDPPAGQVLDGQSLLPVFQHKATQEERAIFWHYPVYHHDIPRSAVRKGDWKLIEDLVSGETRLYNLKVDISESTDLSSMYPEKRDELFTVLKDWQKQVGAEFPVKNPAFDKEKRFEWGTHPDR